MGVDAAVAALACVGEMGLSGYKSCDLSQPLQRKKLGVDLHVYLPLNKVMQMAYVAVDVVRAPARNGFRPWFHAPWPRPTASS